MANRLTLLLITQSQLARIDIVGGKSPQAKNVWTRERIPGESIATLADAAIRLGAKKTGDVWVFSNEFWTGVVHLAGDVAGTLEGDELDQAIALDAETFSGVSAFDSRLGLRSLPKDVSGEARWWVTQIPQSDWHEVDQVVRQFGGKLAGIGHAALAAIPADMSDNESRSWRLNQAFGEATISINGVGDSVNDVVTLGDLKTQRTQSQLLELCDDTSAREQLQAWIADHALPEMIVDSSCPRLLLGDDRSGDDARNEIAGESAIRMWAETMATGVQKGGNDSAVPVAIARKPPMTSQAATLVACALGLLLAIACGALHVTTNRQLADLDSQIDTFKRTQTALATDKKSLSDLEKSLSEKRAQLAEMRASNNELSSKLLEAARIRKFQQTRWLKLVGALAKASESGCWVRGLESRDNVVTVQGIAVSTQDISEFATSLEQHASPHGWRVHPAQTQRNEMALVDFEVTLDVSDRFAPQPQLGSSRARSIPALSFITPIQPAQTEGGP